MRRLADALPTLRDAAPAGPAPLPATLRIERFDAPAREPKAFARPGRPPAGEATPDAFDVAALRASLLKRREAAPPAAQPVLKAAPFVTSRAPAAAATIPSLDGPREDADARIDAAVAAIRLECEREKAEAVEFARKVERDVAARALADAREAWVRDEASALRAGLADLAETLHVRLSDAFGGVLAPLADAAVRDVAVRRFAAMLDDLVGTAPAAPAVIVKGPPDLVAACRTLMGDMAVRFEVAPLPDLVADIGDTRLETTLAAFAETLAAAVAPSAPTPVRAAGDTHVVVVADPTEEA